MRVNCAKHKRHVAPNSFMNLAETVHRTVSILRIALFESLSLQQKQISGSPKSVSFLGKRRKEQSVYYEFQRNSFKHGIAFDASQVRAEFSSINKKQIIKQGSYKKQRYYKTVPRTVFPKFFALVVRRIWSILSQVRALHLIT